MGEQPGDLARTMAAGPIVKAEVESEKAPKVSKGNPLLKVLGSPTFVAGDGKQYERTTGFGSSRKPHPDGGTNETVAYIIFRPFDGLEMTMEGRIYCERFVTKEGKGKRLYSITLPMLKVERKDAKGKAAIENLKITLRNLYQTSDLAKAVSKGTVERPVASDRWEESD